MLTLPQSFDRNHVARSRTKLYVPAMRGNNAARVNGANYLKNFAHASALVGALASWSVVAGTAGASPFTATLTGVGPLTTGQTLELADGTTKGVIVLFGGVYNNAAGFYHRIGEAAPPVGRGNIIIDATNIKVTADDGTVVTAAHGKAYVAGDRYLIGVQTLPGNTLVYGFTSTGDTISAPFLSGAYPANQSITIADEFALGAVGNGCRLNAMAVFSSTETAAALTAVQAQHNRWRKGQFLLVDALNVDD